MQHATQRGREGHLICEGAAVDALAASAVVVGEVTTLDHEPLDDTVEARPAHKPTNLSLRDGLAYSESRPC